MSSLTRFPFFARLLTPLVCALSIGSVLSRAREARANPRPLPFTYPYETLPEGSLELELYGDLTPLRVQADPTDPSKGRIYEPGYTLQNEFEYGVSDRYELGFYQVFEANPQDGGSNTMQFDGFKWRVRTRLAEAGVWPVDVGLYLELETMHDELSLEEKVNLARRFGDLRWMANLWVEQSMPRPLDAGTKTINFIINPTTGFTYQVTPTFHPGIEYWARGILNGDAVNGVDAANRKVHHFLGPVVHLDFGKLWWSFGLYLDLTNPNNPQPGEMYGPVWVRTVLGMEL